MSLPLLQTKLYLPRRAAAQGAPAYVQRLRLQSMLRSATTGKLTLLSAPAGFGKSTLLAEWIHDVELQSTAASNPTAKIQHPKFCWLALDAGDNDPVRFWTYVITALQTAHTELGVVALELLRAPQPPAAEALLTLLINDLAALPDTCILVLDDYHLIETPAIHQVLAFLLDHLPASLHLVLSSRTDPPLPLARLRARSQLTELRAADLRFTLDEATTFLNEVMNLRLAADDITALESRTEGWIAGLQLAALSLRGRRDAREFVRAFTGSHQFIIDYLAEEVLGQQPAVVQAFLLETSILDRLCATLCNAVTARTDSQAILERLQQQNLFLIALDDERHWFRYHHLFAEVLGARLRQAQAGSEDSVAELHCRASFWYEQQNLLGEAISHALAAGAFAQVARLLERMGLLVFGQGASHYALTKWLAALPIDLVRLRPKLCLLQAWLLFNRLDPEAAQPWLDHAEQALPRDEMADDGGDVHNLRGEIMATRAITNTLSRHFEPEQVKRWAQAALACLRPDNASYRGLVFGVLGTAAMQQGDVTRAATNFAEAATISRTAGHEYIALATAVHLTNMQRACGALTLAIATCRQALDWATAQGAQNSFGAGNLMIQLADLLLERNELTAALHQATAGVALAQQGAHPSLFLVGSLVLVRIKQALGEWAGIDDLLQQMGQTAAPLYQADWIVALLPDVAARLRLAQGDLAAAWLWAQQTDWPEPVANYFRGTHHFVYADEYSGITRAQVLLAALTQPFTTDVQQVRVLDVMAYLAPQIEFAAANGRLRRRIKLTALQALAYRVSGEPMQAQTMLSQALTLAEPEGYIRIFVDEGEPMKLLILDFRFWIAQQAPNEQQRRLLTYANILLVVFGGLSDGQDSAASTVSVPIQKLKSKIQNLVEPLTPRELEVLQLIAAGHSNREIARALIVSLGTVKKHLSNIFGKLATESRMQTVARARELDLL